MGTQPENTHGFQTQTQPNPYPKFDSGSGITLGYPNFGYPIPTIAPTYLVSSNHVLTSVHIGNFFALSITFLISIWILLKAFSFVKHDEVEFQKTQQTQLNTQFNWVAQQLKWKSRPNQANQSSFFSFIWKKNL